MLWTTLPRWSMRPVGVRRSRSDLTKPAGVMRLCIQHTRTVVSIYEGVPIIIKDIMPKTHLRRMSVIMQVLHRLFRLDKMSFFAEVPPQKISLLPGKVYAGLTPLFCLKSIELLFGSVCRRTDLSIPHEAEIM